MIFKKIYNKIIHKNYQNFPKIKKYYTNFFNSRTLWINELSKRMKVIPQILRNFTYDKKQDIDISEIQEINKLAQKKIGSKGRILIRLSGTEPLIRVMGESRDELYLTKTINEVIQIIENKFS